MGYWNPEKKRVWRLKNYAENRERILERNRRYYYSHLEECRSYTRNYRREVMQRLKEYRHEYLRHHSCSVCGSTVRLEFHHRKPKPGDRCVGACHSMKSLEREIKKCVVLCRLCHEDIHCKLRNKLRKKKICPHCGGRL